MKEVSVTSHLSSPICLISLQDTPGSGDVGLKCTIEILCGDTQDEDSQETNLTISE